MGLPYGLRLRPDLLLKPQDDAAGTWVVKDPIALRFYLFGADEHFVLQRLDGSRTSEDILDEFARERAPRKLTRARLHEFLGSLSRSGLTCSDAAGQGAQLLERDSRQRSRTSWQGWINLLAIRLPGVNPDAWLDRTYPALSWLFSTWCLACCLLLWAVAGLVLVEAWPAFRADMPRVDQLLGSQNLPWLAAALAGVKVLHELAHAFTCKRFGGRCHEIGLMFLVFTPCLYCNVTDAWMLRSRWRRIAISAAGILTELHLAAIAVLVWRFTQPGVAHAISLNVIIVCSVGTILFNGNPLLKYDGYYMLSDLVRVPNLWSEARQRLFGRVGEWFLGAPYNGPVEPPARAWALAAYALAAIVYRVVLTCTILLFLYRWLSPMGFDVLLLVVAMSVGAQTAYAWSIPVARWWADPRRFERMRIKPTMIFTLGAAAIVGGFCFLPLPCRVAAPFVMQPREAERIYVATPGVLLESAIEGTTVARGDLIARLENTELQDERLRIEGELQRALTRVEALEANLASDSESAAQLAVAREVVADLRQQSALRETEASLLTIRAPAAGEVIPPPRAPASPATDEQLVGWAGTPLDPANRGCDLQRGVLLCLLGDARQCDARLYLDEADIALVRVGQEVRLRLDAARTRVLTGVVSELSEIDADPTSERGADTVDSHHASSAAQRFGGRTVYQARVELTSPGDAALAYGAEGEARVDVVPQTLAQRTLRWFSKTLSVEQPIQSQR